MRWRRRRLRRNRRKSRFERELDVVVWAFKDRQREALRELTEIAQRLGLY